jgi:hypothetical protein
MTCANVSSAASTAARGIGGTIGIVFVALAISLYSDAPLARGRREVGHPRRVSN